MKQKSRLFYLALAVCLPPIGIILLAALDLIYFHENMEMLARSYVENFTEKAVARLEKSVDGPIADERIWNESGSMDLMPGFRAFPA